MAIGDVHEATSGDCTDLYYVDTGMYDVAEYGSVYVIDDKRPAIVDSGLGTNRELVLDALDEVGVAPADLEVIALTHVHLDHAGGAGYLVDECPNAEVYVHEAGYRHVVDPERLWEGTKRAVGDQIDYYVEPRPIDEDRLTEISDGDDIDLGEHSLEVHHAPGHAPHQVVYHDPANDAVFAADAAGIYTPSTDEVHVTSPPSNFSLDECLDDVDMLREIDPDVLCYGHFGDATTGDKLDEYEEILDAWVEAVREQRAELGDDEAVIEYFADRGAEQNADLWGERKARAEAKLNARGVLVSLDKREAQTDD